MKEKEYQHELRRLHGELVALQEWVKASGAKVCVVFEGRDTAGKGGTIKAITERVSPRVFRVVALPAPTEREKSQMYFQRYIPHLPAGGRGRDLRPQLVQPRRRGAGHGLLHRRAEPSASSSRCPRSRKRWSTRVSGSSSTGSRSAPTNRPAGWRAASTIRARSGSCPTWTSRRIHGGTTTHGLATRCSRRPTPAGHRGTWRRRMTRSARGLNIITHLLGQIPYEPPKRKKVTLPERVVRDDTQPGTIQPRRHPDAVLRSQPCASPAPKARGKAVCSDAFECFQSTRPDRLGERLIVPLVLVCVALGEVGDRLVEPVLLAEVRGDARSGRPIGRAPAPASDRRAARRTRGRRAPSPRRRPSPSCRAAGASTDSGWPPRPSSSRGRCRSRPASSAVPARLARRAAGSGSSAGGPPAPTRSPP